MAGRSQARLRAREGVDHYGRTAYEMGELSTRTHAQQQAAATARGHSAPPACTALPVVTGTKELAATLTCSAGTFVSATSDTITRTYRWYRDGFAMSTTTNTRVLVSADLTAQVRCRVTATDENGATTVFTVAV